MAKAEASKIFAKIGVRLLWRDRRSCTADSSVIVSFSYQTPQTDHPAALAYALPYDGSRIIVFYDRVQEASKNHGGPHLLAYVLVHEITHILQGVNRHSDTGIMKASWNSDEFFAMGQGRLVFAPEDVFIVRQNLDTRNARAEPSAVRAAKQYN